MSDEITASYTFDANALSQAFGWHHRRKLVRRVVVYVIACLFVLVSFYSGLSSEHAIPTHIYLWSGAIALVLVFLLWHLIQSGNRLMWRRHVNAMPLCGKAVTWTATQSGLKCLMNGADAAMDWSVILESVSTPDGVLIYPQKNLFYWLPKSAFATAAQYSELHNLVAAKTKHSEIK